MKSRFTSLAFLYGALGALSACSAMESNSAALANADAGVFPAGRLAISGKAEISLLPSHSALLRAVYTPEGGGDASGVAVEFAVIVPETQTAGLSSDAAVTPPSASLTVAAPLTDEQGIAETRLTVGSTPGKFRVRASIDPNHPVYFDVVVRNALTPSVTVDAVYDGLREVAARSATAVASTTCDQAMAAGMVGQEVRSAADTTTPLVLELGAGLTYAVVAWGQDSTNAVVARGCSTVETVFTADEAQANQHVSVKLEDLPMRLMGNYKLELSLDVSASMKRLHALANQQAQAWLSGTSTSLQAQAYLVAIGQVSGQAAALGSVDVSALASALSSSKTGLLPAADALGALFERVGSELVADVDFGVGAGGNVPMMLSVTSMVAHSADASTVYNFGKLAGYVLPAASVVASYDDARAQVDITPLSINCGLDAYGRALLDSAAVDPDWKVTLLGAAAGCDQLSQWIADTGAVNSVCQGQCPHDACSTALGTMVSQVRAGLPTLLADHGAINVRGVIAAHDRAGDGVVDDLGPTTESLEGNWGQASLDETEDAVTAVVGPPSSESAL